MDAVIAMNDGLVMLETVRFRLLGPLEVAGDGEPLEIRSGRQRIVLSMLLLHANKVVPLSRLIDAIWAENPPETARGQVQTCISALRRQLTGIGSGCEIVTRSVGYAILVPAHALDVGEFEHLVRRGRLAVADDRAEEGVRDLRAALALWRGPAAEGVESKLVQAAVTRLNENRVSVLEECIDLELALGRHHRLIGELGELVKAFPLRERLRAQHMLALYRSARQAEALESFREARRVFSDELGIDPGEELRSLERSVLANDHTLDFGEQPSHVRQHSQRGPARSEQDALVVPHQLPAAIADFTGREHLRKILITRLTGGEADETRYVPVVVLTGKAGVGKTALALHVAHAIRQEYPDGQLLAQLREADGQPVSSSELQAQFLRALGVPTAALPSGLAERTAAYRSALGDRRVLIVLDDADSLNQVSPLIPGSANCAVIIASRHPLSALPGAQHFEVDDLDEQTSLDLLAQIIGADRVEAEISAALALVRLCGCLPLALRIAAAKLATRSHWRIDKMVARMTDEGRRLDELVLSGTGVRATLSLSCDRLDKAARQLFLRLGLLGSTDFASWVSAPLLEMDAEAAADVLDTLVEARLVEVRVHESGGPRFRLHDLVRIYALERLAAEESMAERAAALRRLLGCWLSLAAQAHRRSHGGDFAVLHGKADRWHLPAAIVDQLLDEPLSWFRMEHAGLVSAIQQAAHVGFDELCWDLAITSVTLFESERHADDWRKTHEIALEATRRAGNRRGEAAVLYSLGTLAIWERLGDAEGHLYPAFHSFDMLNDAHGRALTLAALAVVDRLGGRHEQALARYLDALAVFRAVGDRVSEVHALTSISQIQLDQERFEVAQELLDQAMVICRSLQAPRVMAQTEYRLGELFLRKGDLNQAELIFRLVRQIFREEHDRVGDTYALLGLGIVHTRQEQHAMAEDDLRAALSLSRHLGDNLLHGQVLLAYAELQLAWGEPESATSPIDEAFVVFSEIGRASICWARLLELRARRDELTGRKSAAAATRRAALELAGDSDPAWSRAVARRLRAASSPQPD